MDNTLSVVPLLEEVASILLMAWVDFRQEHHLIHQLSLLETLVHKQIILLVHSSMTALARSLEDFEASSESGGVVGVPGDLGWPVRMSMMHTNGVNLLFVTLDTVRGTNVISEEPSISLLVSTKSKDHRASLNCFAESAKLSLVVLTCVERRFHFYLVTMKL